ncbi:MAG: ABC transporter ATP-binding protein [Caldilinea sp.]
MQIPGSPLLEVNHLHTSFFTFSGEVQAVRDVSFRAHRGEIVGVVGESGSGKSVTFLSVTRLLSASGKIVGGEVRFDGENVLAMSHMQLRKLRNQGIGMVFQEPMTSLNPTMQIGVQIVERIRAFNKGISNQQARAQAVRLLESVRIPEAKNLLKAYPYELSGGMRQRVMFAIAIATGPKLLIADEPTTSLDVTIQNQILKLIRSLRNDTNVCIILITHDLGVVAETCERVIVMYGGMIMEEGLVDEIFYETAHPYTIGLRKSIPNINQLGGDRLYSVPGSPPNLLNPPQGCPFYARCDQAMRICKQHRPPYYQLSPTHRSMCWLLDPDYPGRGGGQ